MTPNELEKIAENSGWSDPTRITVVNLIELWKAAEKFVIKFCHAEDCAMELKHDDECTCGYSWFEEALQNLEEK